MTKNDVPAPAAGRGQRRQARTRAALISAAQQLIARGEGDNPSIQTITDLADVGFGSFYNHFSSKPELMRVAFEDAFGQFEAWLAERAGDDDDEDAVSRLVRRIRLTGHLGVDLPQVHRILVQHAGDSMDGPFGLMPGAVTAIDEAIAAAPVPTKDADVVRIAIAGAMAAVLRWSAPLTPPEQVRITDGFARVVLQMLRVPAERAEQLLGEPVGEGSS